MFADEIFRRRRLPHWDVPGATYFVTTCLNGSLPAQGLAAIERHRLGLEKRPRPVGLSEADWKVRCWKLTFVCVEGWLDLQPGVKHLADARLARAVAGSVYHFAEERYDLLAYTVMPSHLHWLFCPRQEWVDRLGAEAKVRTPRERIMQSLKRFTGLKCNRLLGRQGAFWQDESYDHCVRDVDELERIIHYIEENPVRAGLVGAREQWPFGSARDRALAGIPLGQPLPHSVGQIFNLPVAPVAD